MSATSRRPPVADRVDVLGCAVDRVTLDQAAAVLEQALAEGRFISQFSVNAAKVVAIRRDPEIAAIAARADLVTADGSSVVLASRLFGDPLPERVTGIDLMYRLFEIAERRGFAVYILGATPIRSRPPRPSSAASIRPSSWPDPATATSTWMPTARWWQRSSRSKADILLAAMGSPRTELWLDARARGLGVSVALGVGGSVDVLAGRVKRAPEVFQRLHLEWLYRLAQEPRRLIGRNLVERHLLANGPGGKDPRPLTQLRGQRRDHVGRLLVLEFRAHR